MKKIKKILFTMLAMALVLVPANKIFAAESSVTDYDTRSEVTELETNEINIEGSEFNYKYYYVDVASTGTDSELIVPITLETKGKLYITAGLSNLTDKMTPDVQLFTDNACTKEIYANYSNGYYVIPSDGTYYFKISVHDSTTIYEPTAVPVELYNFVFGTVFMNGGNRTLTNKVEVLSSFEGYDKPVYYKVTVSKPGIITINVDSEYSSYVTLCNSSKKAISDETSSSSTNGKFTYATSKGTYYVKVKTSSDYAYVKSTTKAITDASGTTKAKAAKLTVNGSKKNGLVVTSDKANKADWFKFSNPKNQKITVYFNGAITSGDLEIEFFDSKGESFGTKKFSIYSDGDASFSPYVGSFASTSGKLPKGTYYIKVTKKTAKASASYSIQIKNK